MRSAELRKHDRRIRLQEQPFQILVALLARPGEVVLREELRAKLWPDNTVVEFDHSINAAVKRLREALRDSAEEPRYIETVPRRGYRFIGQIEDPPATAIDDKPQTPSQANSDTVPNAPPEAVRRFGSRLVIPLGVVVCMSSAMGAWMYYRAAPARWARHVAIPKAERLVTAGRYPTAFELIARARQVIPRDPELNRILREISHPISIRTTPAAANVYLKAYDNPHGPWLLIGQTPLENFLLPLGYYRWKAEKSGYRTVEGGAGIQTLDVHFTLDEESRVPPGMVHVPGDAAFQLFSLKPVKLDDYWADEYEVTNRQYKQFVDGGGYRNRQFWLEPFMKEGRVVSWEDAISEFRDATGRTGPATWEAGGYPAGQDDFPVGGVSWYEAAAYAQFAQKRLPTVYHWFRAANLGIWSDILQFSNFSSSGPEKVGVRGGLGPFGTFDMAGNVREWCWNATGDRRYVLGGAWNDERFAYSNMTAISPFDRSAANGFRCVRPSANSPKVLTQPVVSPLRDRQVERPVSDDVYRILKSIYSYDRAELRAVTESIDETSVYWRSERITFDAGYDRQRVVATLYIPKGSKPPYQTIIFFPPRSAAFLARIDESDVKRIEFLMKSGRAVLFPTYEGTYERRLSGAPGPNTERDGVIHQRKDLQRSIDYLDTRGDIAHDQLGYYGLSDGARLGLIMVADELRIRAAVFSHGGLSPQRKAPEIDEINFASRVRIPVLMLNGRYDLLYPAEADQLPMFRLLGTPEGQKRYVAFDAGHVLLQQQDMKQTLDWFDKYLGPARK
ncbi:MAG TPA: SUMF1/EgtB/PvdO family nonheme iron enzyme [Bryobacteraceae bacterium]|nr:SUMF1/EgtB/PvdO family nonheme iron enzyme [Bryobacteraceae bacterium]